MFMLWISSQSFAQNARSSLATTDLASSLNRSRNDPLNSGDASKRLYVIRPGMDGFSCHIKAINFGSGVNIKRERSVAEKRPPFPALADLRKFSGNCCLSAAPSIRTLFRTKPVSMSTKTAGGRGLQ